MTNELPSQNNEQALQAATTHIEEFPGDPLVAAGAAAKELRMNEMENWANGIGAHTERLVEAHRTVAKQIIAGTAQSGRLDKEAAQRRLSRVGKDWRTGVEVERNGDVVVHDGYPYDGDSRVSKRHYYRSPANIKK